MKNIMFSVVISSLLTGSALAAEPALKCYPNKEFMKMIDENNLTTVYNGFKKDSNKVTEIMMSNNRYMYTVEYDKAADGSASKADQYCIVSVLQEVTFNETALDYLHGLLEKFRGQKT